MSIDLFTLCSPYTTQHFERQLDSIGKSLVLIHIVDKKQFKYWMNKLDDFTNDLHNSKVIAPEQRKQDYSIALIIDDLQDIVEGKDSGIVSALQAWRHRNVTIVCLNQTFSQNLRHRSIYSHCSHFLFFRLSYANSMFSFLNQIPSLLRVTSRGVNGQITIKPRIAIQQIYYDACCATNKTFGHLLLDLSSNKIHHTLLLRTAILNVNEQRSYSINADGVTFTSFDTIRAEGEGNEHQFRLLDKQEHIKKETYKQGEKIKEVIEKNGRSDVTTESTGRDTRRLNKCSRGRKPYERSGGTKGSPADPESSSGGGWNRFRQQRIVRRGRAVSITSSISSDSESESESCTEEHGITIDDALRSKNIEGEDDCISSESSDS